MNANKLLRYWYKRFSKQLISCASCKQEELTEARTLKQYALNTLHVAVTALESYSVNYWSDTHRNCICRSLLANFSSRRSGKKFCSELSSVIRQYLLAQELIEYWTANYLIKCCMTKNVTYFSITYYPSWMECRDLY